MNRWHPRGSGVALAASAMCKTGGGIPTSVLQHACVLLVHACTHTLTAYRRLSWMSMHRYTRPLLPSPR